MNSIIDEVMSRTGAEEPKRATAQMSAPSYTSDDEELERILAGLKTNIKIFGCGGGGCNTIDRLVEEGITGAELYAANTDAQHLLRIKSPHKILLGRRSTKGLGAGALPQIGEEAAKEAEDDIRAALDTADVVFVTCGLGGGTGTGSAPFVAKLAKEMGALTIAICTSPFKAEGAIRMENAEWGLEKLRSVADTVIVIPNDKLIELYPRLGIMEAFKVADEVLVRSIKGITEIVTKPGLVNLDFNDLKTVMKGGGVAMIGLGKGEGEDRTANAMNEAINSPLIDVDITAATGALVNVTGGPDMSIGEAESIAETLQSRISSSARIIWGASVDPTMEGKITVMVVITGVKSKHILGPTQQKKSLDIDFIG